MVCLIVQKWDIVQNCNHAIMRTMFLFGLATGVTATVLAAFLMLGVLALVGHLASLEYREGK